MSKGRLRAAVLAIAIARVAFAEPSPAAIKEAAAEFDQGVQAARAGDPESAAVHFEKADELAPSDAALRAAIRARRDAKQLGRAATLAALAMVRHPDKLELQTFAHEVIDAAAKQTARVAVTCKPACEAVVDRKLVHGGARKELTLFLDPGKHAIGAGWGQKSSSKEIVAVAGESPKLVFDRPAEPAAAATTTASEPPTAEPETGEAKAHGGLPRGVFYGGLALTGVLAGVTAWSGFDTKNNPGADAVRTACVGKGDACPQYQDGLSRQHRTNALLVGTGIAFVATAVVGAFFTRWGSDAEAPTQGFRATPTIDVGPGGASLGAAGRF